MTEPKHLQVSAEDVHPEPARRKQVSTIMIVFAVGLLALTAAVYFIVSGFYSTVDNRSRERDVQRQHDIARIAKDEDQIRVLANQIATNQAKTTNVLCTAIVTSVTQQKQGPTKPSAAQLKLTIKFLRDYGCKVPAGL